MLTCTSCCHWSSCCESETFCWTASISCEFTWEQKSFLGGGYIIDLYYFLCIINQPFILKSIAMYSVLSAILRTNCPILTCMTSIRVLASSISVLFLRLTAASLVSQAFLIRTSRPASLFDRSSLKATETIRVGNVEDSRFYIQGVH